MLQTDCQCRFTTARSSIFEIHIYTLCLSPGGFCLVIYRLVPQAVHANPRKREHERKPAMLWVYMCVCLCSIITVWCERARARVSGEKHVCYAGVAPSYLDGFLQMNILSLPDASVNRDAAAVYRAKLKSQTSLGLHSKCRGTWKHTLQWSGTLTQIHADSKTASALTDSVKVL